MAKGERIRLRPNPASPGAAAAWQIFLSSTIKDLEGYRRSVQEVLLQKAEVVVFLSEDWPGGYDDTVRKCKARVEGADGFFLMMGYWYGSIPPGYDKSITHLEFEWAFGKWGQTPFPPIAVFRPKPQSQADQELRTAAEPLIATGYSERPRHDTLLQVFQGQVLGSWRTVREFTTLQDLREYSLTACLIWKGQTPQAAARGDVALASSGTRLTDEQLGLLGRKKQHDAAEGILAELPADPDVPAACLLVSGSEDAGQRAFLAALLRTQPFKSARPSKPGRPPLDHYDVAVLIQWVAKVLGIAGGAEIKTPAELADRVAAELKRQPLWFALDQVSRLGGGIAVFRDSFWKPFYDRLKELRATQPIPHRLIAVVTEYSGDSTAWAAAVSGPDFDAEPADFSKLLLLPTLTDFTRRDVLLWLGKINLPEARRAQLADSVLQDDQGKPDGTPLRVFDRLQRQSLWPEDEEDD